MLAEGSARSSRERPVNRRALGENLVDVLFVDVFHGAYLALIRFQDTGTAMVRSVGPLPAAINAGPDVVELSYRRHELASG